jgi:hypothetical protein
VWSTLLATVLRQRDIDGIFLVPSPRERRATRRRDGVGDVLEANRRATSSRRRDDESLGHRRARRARRRSARTNESDELLSIENLARGRARHLYQRVRARESLGGLGGLDYYYDDDDATGSKRETGTRPID